MKHLSIKSSNTQSRTHTHTHTDTHDFFKIFSIKNRNHWLSVPQFQTCFFPKWDTKETNQNQKKGEEMENQNKQKKIFLFFVFFRRKKRGSDPLWPASDWRLNLHGWLYPALVCAVHLPLVERGVFPYASQTIGAGVKPLNKRSAFWAWPSIAETGTMRGWVSLIALTRTLPSPGQRADYSTKVSADLLPRKQWPIY